MIFARFFLLLYLSLLSRLVFSPLVWSYGLRTPFACCDEHHRARLHPIDAALSYGPLSVVNVFVAILYATTDAQVLIVFLSFSEP